MRLLILLATSGVLAACTSDVTGPFDGRPTPPTNLRYELVPSGRPDRPEATVLRWTPPGDPDVVSFFVYSRGASGSGWTRRAQTSSPSFHDLDAPSLQYYVTSVDEEGVESDPSAVVTVTQQDRLPAPAGLASISLNRAIQSYWSASVRQANPGTFGYYRVYSTVYDLDAGVCVGAQWVLEGTTSSEEFLITGLPNGAPRCMAVSAVNRAGLESAWTQPVADTPRHDARNILLSARQANLAGSGFTFQRSGTTQVGLVVAGDRTDADFVVDRQLDGSLWLVPVRARLARYGSGPIADLTSIDLAPARSAFSTTPLQALPGHGYVFEMQLADGLHYGAARVTHVGQDHLILDWSYQSDPGNPMLRDVGM